MEQVTTKGGVRRNAGRKPSTDKKVSIFCFIPTSTITKVGDKKKVKELLENYAKTL